MIRVKDIVEFHFSDDVLKYRVRTDSLNNLYYLSIQERTDVCNDEVFIKLNLDKDSFCNTGLPDGIFPYHSSLEQLQITIDRLQEEIKKKYGTSKSNPGIKYYNSYRADWIWYEETFIDRPKKKEEIINNKIRLNELSRKIISHSGIFEGRSFAVSSSKEEIRI